MVSRALMVVYTILFNRVFDTVAQNEDEAAHILMGIAQHIQPDQTRSDIPPDNTPATGTSYRFITATHCIYNLFTVVHTIFFYNRCFINTNFHTKYRTRVTEMLQYSKQLRFLDAQHCLPIISFWNQIVIYNPVC